MERERKFLVKKLPNRLKQFPHTPIQQGYLAIPDVNKKKAAEIRVRDEKGKHVLTVKSGDGATRQEVEIPISKQAFGSLWPLTQGKRIGKVRYKIPLGKHTLELDVYQGKLRGLVTAEVEFDSDRQLREFKPPPWLGRDVTGKHEFGNSRLATSGKPRAVRRR